MGTDPGRLSTDFPLFPLDLVALPTEIIPLHIFEPRYRTMIAECIERDGEFGIVWLADDELHDVGCACRVDRVLERMEDGRLNLLARGTRPLRIIERRGHLAYPAGIVEFLADEPQRPDRASLEAAHAAYVRLVTRATDNEPSPADVEEMSAYAMAATVDFGLDVKQGLLELRSEPARLALVTRLFRAALKRLDFVDHAQTRARSNGKVRFG